MTNTTENRPDANEPIDGSRDSFNEQLLLDAFADARRSWDDLVTLQPDVKSGAGQLTRHDIAELARRVGTHQSAIAALSDILNTNPRSRDSAVP